ncbi:MAG TPA: hypothetical protein VHZ55_05910 [Bryobacteraceae bacterium]|nr:hypothetical protein [Bryobacteraceae bacterium]
MNRRAAARTAARPALLAVVIFVSGSVQTQAQTGLRLPGCAPAAEVSDVVDHKLDPRLLDRMNVRKRLAFQRQTLTDLIARYPRELLPYENLRDVLRQYAPDEYPAFREGWIKMAQDTPTIP